MAFNIQYGPISAAIEGGQQAGNAERLKAQRQADMEFIRMVQQNQQEAQRQHANQIQTALGVQQQNIENAQQAIDKADALAFRNAQLAQQKQEQEANEAARQQQLQMQQTHLANEDAINAYKAQQPGPRDTEQGNLYLRAQQQSLNLMAQQRQILNQLEKSRADELDPISGAPSTKPGYEGFKAGHEDEVDRLRAQYQTLETQRKNLAPYLSTSLQLDGTKSVLDPGEKIDAPRVSPQPAPAPEQQTQGVTAISTQAQYDALPPGTRYTVPSHPGVVYVKGNR